MQVHLPCRDLITVPVGGLLLVIAH